MSFGINKSVRSQGAPRQAERKPALPELSGAAVLCAKGAVGLVGPETMHF